MKGIKAYKKQRVQHASKEALVLRLFETAILKLWEGHSFISNSNKIESVEPLRIARQIIFELYASLDHEEGGELTAQLQQLYLWIIKEISAAGFKGDTEALESTILVLDNIYSGFKEAFAQTE